MTKTAKGRPVTTRRGRTAGGREARCWLSAEEYSELEEQASAQGVSVAVFVRLTLLTLLEGQQ